MLFSRAADPSARPALLRCARRLFACGICRRCLTISTSHASATSSRAIAMPRQRSHPERSRSGHPHAARPAAPHPVGPPCPAYRTPESGAEHPDPVRRMRRRLRDLPSCAICAEIADARAEWLVWLTRRSGECRQDIGCAAAVPRSRLAGARRGRPGTCAGARRNRPARGRAASRLRRRRRRLACRGSRRLLDRLGARVRCRPGVRPSCAAPPCEFAGSRPRVPILRARPRGAANARCRCVAALVENADGRRAVRERTMVCASAMRHARGVGLAAMARTARALALLWPGDRCGAGRAARGRRMGAGRAPLSGRGCGGIAGNGVGSREISRYARQLAPMAGSKRTRPTRTRPIRTRHELRYN